MAIARAYHTATLLRDGRVMVVGGTESGGKPLASVEIYDPKKDAWSEGPPLHIARTGHTASVLPDGSVLVAGGIDGDGRAIAVTERWRSSDNRWSVEAGLAEPRGFQQATTLNSGDVLISGGVRAMDGDRPAKPATLLELWRAAEGRWITVGMMPFPSFDHLAVRGANDLVYLFGYNGYYGSATLVWAPHESENLVVEHSEANTITRLPDGRFLLAGGRRFRDLTSAALVYDPEAYRWTSAGPMHLARADHHAVLLQDGRVLVVGGTVADNESRQPAGEPPTYPGEIWNPKTRTWSTVHGLDFRSGQSVIPALLPDGRVQLAARDTDAESVYALRIWDPRDESVTVLTNISRPRPGGQVVAFPDGRLLYAGGLDQSAREGQRLDRWDPVTGSWGELPSAPLSLNNNWLIPLQDGGMAVLPRPHDRQAGFHSDPPRLNSILIWQPLWGWRTLPYPPGAGQGQYPVIVPIAKGEVLFHTGDTEMWLWSPDSQQWLRVAQDVSWQPSYGTFFTQGGEVIAFRGHASLEGNRLLLDAARLNRELLRWEPVVDGYITRDRPALVTLLDGRVMVVGGESAVTQIWNPKDNTWHLAAYSNTMLRAPKGLLLKDGRVMVVGVSAQDARRAVCELWSPDEDRWTPCGQFTADTSDLRPDKMLLRYLDGGQVLWVQGSERAMVREPDGGWTATRLNGPTNGSIPLPGPEGTPLLNPIASVWNPRTNHWDDGADTLLLASHGMPGYRDESGNVIAVWPDGRRLVRWLAEKRVLSTIDFPRDLYDVDFDELVPTGDGCFVVWSNRLNSYRVHAPRTMIFNAEARTWTESAHPMALPANARGAVAGDGTLLIAGYSRNMLMAGGGSLRIRASCSGIESLDTPEPLYLPVSNAPGKPAPALPAHIPLPPKPQPGWPAQWRAEWAGHWQHLREHPSLTFVFGILIAFSALRFLVERVGAYGDDPELRSRFVKIDIAIAAATLPILAVALGVPISLIQGLVGVGVSIVGMISTRRLWDYSEGVRDKVLSGASYAICLSTAVLVSGTYIGERFIRLFTFITDYS